MDKSFIFYKQTDKKSCGATCLRMVAKYYKKNFSLKDLVALSHTTRDGANLMGISEAAEKIGLRSLGVKVSISKVEEEAPLPCIAYWNQNHFIVLYKIRKDKFHVADPAHGLLTYSKEEFLKHWIGANGTEGILLLLEPRPEFYSETYEHGTKEKKQNYSFLFNYLRPHSKAIGQLIIGLMAASLLQLIFPFLTQSIVDIGINNHDYSFIYLILISQLMVFFGRTTIEIIRSYILVHVSSRINISLVSDFFAKLMRLPINYFDTKMTGDIMQRIADNRRIENFLTGSSISTLFSVFNFLIFSAVLAIYSLQIFSVFIVGTITYFLWIAFFLKRRADLDFKRFRQNGQNHSKVIEIVNGMQEIKLQNAERQKRWQLETLQIKLFKISLKSLNLTTAQNSGSSLINELKNIFITFLSAKLVLEGQVTIGMMLSISYITGQLNAPVKDMVYFAQNLQDAKLSLERLSEIHEREDEEPEDKELHSQIEENAALILQNVSFKYPGVGNVLVLQSVTVTLPANKVTAIVGSSGSGKTTLVKLLLKFFDASNGTILVGSNNISFLSAKAWRSKCGVVMQEGYIFNDTIANNIAVGVDEVDRAKLRHAVMVANIAEFIDNLPLGFETKIGMEGSGISSGQKQRILIARAVYKDPEYLFFDEATSSLDANNERLIMNNLNEFFKNKTVVVIAHRLSTVKNADQIIVLDKGCIAEIGNHTELTALRGAYYELVKNQLELGN